MKTKKWVVSLFTILILLPMLCVPVHAQDEPEFRYELSVDGKDTVEVSTGDIITVTLYLYRTDADAPYLIYAMQDEIRYDSAFFELVEDSAVLSTGIQSADLAVGQGMREFYMNYISFSGGAQWQSKTRIGSFQLRVIGTSGVATITNEDFLVSYKDGSGSYKCEANILTIIRTTDCTVKFETNGGTSIDPITAIYGEPLTRPENPVREGKYFAGWYKDVQLTEEWNFDTDKVTGNMTLYAKWTDEKPPTSEPKPPEEKPHCLICGVVTENLLCLRCSLITYFLILFLLILILALGIMLYYLFNKKLRAHDEQKDATAEQSNVKDK